jgi:hypothetical protein
VAEAGSATVVEESRREKRQQGHHVGADRKPSRVPSLKRGVGEAPLVTGFFAFVSDVSEAASQSQWRRPTMTSELFSSAIWASSERVQFPPFKNTVSRQMLTVLMS